jgi:hypothetical protein
VTVEQAPVPAERLVLGGRGTARRPGPAARIAAISAFGAAVVPIVVAGAAMIASGEMIEVVFVLPILIAVLAMAAVGLTLAIRVPANKIGWLLLVAAVVQGIGTFGSVYAGWSLAKAGGSLPGTAVAAWIDINLQTVPVLITTVAIPLIYPDGRLLSPRWRWLVALLVLLGIFGILRQALRPGPMPYSGIENPFGIAGIEPLLSATDLTQAFAAILFLGAIASVVIRYRRGSLVERQQLKWLIAATALGAGLWSVSGVGALAGSFVLGSVGWYGGQLAFAAYPIAIGIAVLRYRLYELDRIISRTIAWALVTGVLVVVFAGGVVALQAALTGVTQGQTLAVAASTLLVFALFQPLRRRVQRAVDRRFDRARYDGERTVAAFAERMRGEVDLDMIEAAVADSVRHALRPSSAAVWVRRRGSDIAR